MRRAAPLAAGLAAVALLAAGCSTEGQASATQEENADLPPATLELPSRILGLDLVSEDVSAALEQADGTYLDSLSLFGFRDDGMLRAALQVARFNHLARPDDPAFLARIITRMEPSVPEPIRVGEHTVYMSAGARQYAFLWFRDAWMFVLTVRTDYPFGRTLLRRLVEEAISE